MEKLLKDMTPEEQLQWATSFGQWSEEKLPVLEQLGDAWEMTHVKDMETGLRLLNAFQFCRDYCHQAMRYGDYSARVNRVRYYVDKIKKKMASGEVMKGTDGKVFALVPPQKPATRRGRPASAETIARREAEAKAKEQQQELSLVVNSPAPGIGDIPMETAAEETEFKLTIAQKRMLLSPALQELADKIRDLRTTAAANATKAKTMAELKASPELIAPVAEAAQRTLEQVDQIYQEIDAELAVVWFRLQNDSDQWRKKWMKRYGFKSMEDISPALVHDLKKHYQKMKSDEFDQRCRILIEQESPEYVERVKAEAAKKKEVQNIVAYLRRKDKAPSEARVKTAREKFNRLTILLGKKEAAAYKPLLTKIEEDWAKAAEDSKK